MKKDLIITGMVGIICAVLGVLGGIAIANQVNDDYHAQDNALTIEHCQESGLTNCHAENVYQGMVLVMTDVIGYGEPRSEE